MLIHFLQQIQPPVLPVLQQIRDDNSINMYKKCSKWNVYFYEDLIKLVRRNKKKFSFFKLKDFIFRIIYGKMKINYQPVHYGLNFYVFIQNNLIVMNILLLFDKKNHY